jgi:hypothetical protein
MRMLEDKHAASDEGAKPDEDRLVTERVPTDYEIAEKLGISIEAARALVKASLKAAGLRGEGDR